MEVRNRFKGLDLIDRVPDELRLEVRDIIQETGIKTIPMEKKYKKAKWLSKEALQIAVKRREAKSKGEEGFLLSLCYSLELCTQVGISFPFSFAFSFSFLSYL